MEDKIYEAIKNNLFKTECEFKKGVAKDLGISPKDVFNYRDNATVFTVNYNYDNVTVFTVNYKDTFYDCVVDSDKVIWIKG